MDRIDFKITELEKEKPKKVLQSFICLHEDYIELKLDYYSDEKNEDEMLGWKEDMYNYFHEVASKETVKGVSISFRNKINQWKVNINLVGFTEDIYVMFEDKKEALIMFNKIMEWKYKSVNK